MSTQQIYSENGFQRNISNYLDEFDDKASAYLVYFDWLIICSCVGRFIVGMACPLLWILNWALFHRSDDSRSRRTATVSCILGILSIILIAIFISTGEISI